MKKCNLFYLIGLLFFLAAALNFVTGGDHATAVVWRCLGATFLLLGCSHTSILFHFSEYFVIQLRAH